MISLVADQTRREHVKLMEKTKKGSGTTDLTVGRPLPQILKFALPLVLPAPSMHPDLSHDTLC